MSKPEAEPFDPTVDDVRRTRERLVREHGGLRGWVTHLQEVQAQHPERVVARPKPVVPDSPAK